MGQPTGRHRNMRGLTRAWAARTAVANAECCSSSSTIVVVTATKACEPHPVPLAGVSFVDAELLGHVAAACAPQKSLQRIGVPALSDAQPAIGRPPDAVPNHRGVEEAISRDRILDRLFGLR